MVKKLFKNVTFEEFKFYLGKLNSKKKISYGVMLIFCLFSLQKKKSTKKQRKFNSTIWGKFFIS